MIVTNKDNPTRQYVKSIMDAPWSIEVYHREVKQNCGIEHCQARTSRAQRNHIFSLFLRGLNNINVVYLKK
nr:hypothetical protein [Candidatus Arsenophonus triatominarum]